MDVSTVFGTTVLVEEKLSCGRMELESIYIEKIQHKEMPNPAMNAAEDVENFIALIRICEGS